MTRRTHRTHRATSPVRLRTPLAVGLAVSLAATLAACTARPSDGPTAAVPTGTASAHGFVAGATESQEPQSGLLAVSATGEVALLDLLTGDATTLASVDEPEHSATDGRFLVTSTATRTTITDSGRWTVDHGDHTHYYRAEPRVVGTVDGGGPVEVHSSETTTTVVWPERGEAIALDRRELGDGTIDRTARVAATVLLPLGEGLVAGTDQGVRTLDADGSPTGSSTSCTDPRGGIVTRAGAVIGCADGAVVVEGPGEATTVPLPEGAERPTSFAARAGRPTVAAPSPSGSDSPGVLLLDSREHTWRQVDTDRPLRAVTAVDDADEHLVGVDGQGRVVVVRAGDGAVAATDPVVDPDNAELQLDAQRAYVTDASGRQVHEVDYADGARLARTLELPFAAVVFAEVGP